MRKIILSIGLVIAFVCMIAIPASASNDYQHYRMDGNCIILPNNLVHVFNEETQDGVTASTYIKEDGLYIGVNEDFKAYYQAALDGIAESNPLVLSIAIGSWSPFLYGGLASITIEYTMNSLTLQYEVLDEIEYELEQEWYTQFVDYNAICPFY